ncbi:MAG: sulfate adenylyltransferase subunit 1 [Bacteroidia bacterium]
MELLRFITAGNVDDGKSTLIGRLLYDSQAISTDIIDILTQQSKKTGSDTKIDLALLTDGLRAEREQGITIDVAYKYFSTAKRKFIIADTPGHIQYTRNMFTGASTANLAIILIDAQNGITEQTKRHSIIAAILRIPHVLVCINKMDLVNYNETIYNHIESEYISFAHQLKIKELSFIPASALAGDNVVTKSANMNWFKGLPLLSFLETVKIAELKETAPARFQLQYVIQSHNYNGLAGSITSGSFKKGERVVVLPSGKETIIEKIEVHQKEVEIVGTNTPVVLHLKDNVTISRGMSIAPIAQLPKTTNEFTATLCWMDSTAFLTRQQICLQQNSFRTNCIIKEVISKIDIHSFAELPYDGSMKQNDICKVQINTSEPISYDSYIDNRATGAFILISKTTNQTIAAGTID